MTACMIHEDYYYATIRTVFLQHVGPGTPKIRRETTFFLSIFLPHFSSPAVFVAFLCCSAGVDESNVIDTLTLQ